MQSNWDSSTRHLLRRAASSLLQQIIFFPFYSKQWKKRLSSFTLMLEHCYFCSTLGWKNCGSEKEIVVFFVLFAYHFQILGWKNCDSKSAVVFSPLYIYTLRLQKSIILLLRPLHSRRQLACGPKTFSDHDSTKFSSKITLFSTENFIL